MSRPKRMPAPYKVEFEYYDVTSHDEPDLDCSYIDPAGHEHRYGVETTRYVVDDEGDDEYPERGHHECVQCGARVVFGRKATRFRQYIRVNL